MENPIIWIHIWEALFLIVNSVSSIVLNTLIGYLIYCNRALRTSFNATIMNACVADIVVSINILVTSIQGLAERGEQVVCPTWCSITGFINLISFVASVMSLAAVSINRYFLVCQSHIYPQIFTKTGTSIYIAIVWTLSALISSPPLYGWSEFSYDSGKSICFANWKSSEGYMMFMILICFCGPIAATLLTLFLILKTKEKAEESLDSNQDDFGISNTLNSRANAKRKKRAQSDRKITISIAVVVVIFFIAWGPFVVVMFLEVFWHGAIPRWANMTTFLLGCLNSTANPIIYMTLNTNFRGTLKRRFRGSTISTSNSISVRNAAEQ